MDLLKNVLGIGDNIKNFVTKKARAFKQYVNDPNQTPEWMKSADQALRSFSQSSAAPKTFSQEEFSKPVFGNRFLDAMSGPIAPAIKLSNTKFDFADKIKNPVGSFAASIPQSLMNIPSNTRDALFSGYGDNMDITSKEGQSNLLRRAGKGISVGTDIGSWMMGGPEVKALAVGAFKGAGSQLAKQTALNIIKQGAKTGAKQGFITGAGLGIGQGLQQGSSPVEQAVNALKNGATQAALGYILGGAVGGGVSAGGIGVRGAANEVRNVGRDVKTLFNPTSKKIVNPEDFILRDGQQVPLSDHTIKREAVSMKRGSIDPEIKRYFANEPPKDVFIDTVKPPFQPQSVTFKGLQKMENTPVGLSIKDVSGKMSVGDRIRNKTKGNYGQIVSIDEAKGTARVYFKNKANKTSASVELPMSDLELQGVSRGRALKSAEQVIAEVQGGTRPTITGKPGENIKMANLGINTSKLNVGDETKGVINQAMTELKPKLEQTVGKVMGREEMEKAAESTARTLKKTLSREEVADLGARALNLRQEVATLAEQGKMTPELMDALRRDKEFSSGTARLLQQRSIDVSPGEKPQMLQMIELVNSKVNDIDAVMQAAQGVDFNDAHQSAIFYRQFVKPKIGDWIDVLRYNSMLSSPLTHVVNISSNLVNSGAIAPIEKTVAGAVDFLGSAVTGKERTQFAGEGTQHLVGYMKSFGDAAHRFAEVMKGERLSGNLDTRNIPLVPGSKIGTKIENSLSYPMKLLEGMDQFFTALTEGGERASLNYRAGKGVAVNDLEKQVREKAAYRIYREDLHADRQGTVLDAVDTVTGLVMKARNSKNGLLRNVAKWTVPFIKTPMNIFKQGLEYSPAGFATMHGAENKVEQAAKAIIGSTIFMGAGLMLESGRLTWAEPINEKEKNAFRAAGLQPYSIKLGDTWYSYQKLPPGLSFSLAMVAAIDDTQKNAKLGDDAVDQILTAVSKYGQFLSDQSYAKSIGDLLTAAKGGESGITRLLSNYPQQVVPYRALGGWLARLTDDVQRKVDPSLGFIDKQVQLLMQNVPLLSQYTPARKDQYGNDIENTDNVANAFSPVRMSTENPQMKEQYDSMMGEKQANSQQKQLKEALKTGGSIPNAEGKSEALKAMGKAGDYIYAFDLEKYTGENKEAGIKKYTHQTDKALVARNIMEGTEKYKDIPDDVKPEIYKSMGLDEHDVEYDYMANQPGDAVAQYLNEEFDNANLDHNSVVRALVNGRRASISGKMMVSNTVVDEMYKAGKITKAEQIALKKVKIGKNGQNQSTVSGGGSRKKSVSALVTALKNGPKLGGQQKISSKSKVAPLQVPKMNMDATLKTSVPKANPISIAQLFQKVATPDAPTSVTKARNLVAGMSAAQAPAGSNKKLSTSFYRG